MLYSFSRLYKMKEKKSWNSWSWIKSIVNNGWTAFEVVIEAYMLIFTDILDRWLMKDTKRFNLPLARCIDDLTYKIEQN